MRSSIYNNIDFENSRKRECESDYFNSKFFEMFPTKYEKLLREYEVILFKDNVKTSFLSMDFSDDFLYDGEYSFVERIFLTLFGIIRLKDSEKSFDNFIDFEKIKKFKEIFDKIYREIFNEKIDKGDKKVIDFMNELKLEISKVLKRFSLEEVKEYREIIKEYAGTTWEKMKKLRKKSESLFHKKILLYKLVSLENLLNIQYERHFLQNYVCVWNDLYLDNDYDDNGAFSNLFFLNKIDKGIYFADDMVLFSFELVKVAKSFDEFMDNIEKFNLASYSRFFKK
ncbi:hypothetical protein HW276_05915 [Leptotrichia sp. oral taxon 417]|uniref:hypothetical protein n=1 Tax=Leptotrichia sp. oral taxon 417 TaxID=712365 RepID=UPI0015B7BBCD|nr:hypothetical protein [Leptotrichia sp. oral taxon 417]NWO27257.1 hypothetical protein [Leptotrichia sp. oral taxon 417]